MKNEQLRLYGGDKIPVKVSAKWLSLKLHPCDPDYILGGCQGQCCLSKDGLIAITKAEAKQLRLFVNKTPVFNNARIEDRFIVHTEGDDRCPFQDRSTYLCHQHKINLKPIDCHIYPFTLTGNTLVIRHRHVHTKCYRDQSEKINKKIEAFKSFRYTLDVIFGEEQAGEICSKMEKYCGDVVGEMPVAIYNLLKSNDHYRAMYKKSKAKK
jgi:Fe-S-cluster containining protein